MFIRAQVEPHLNRMIGSVGDVERAHLSVILQMMDGRERICAGTRALNRYSIQPGKTFAASTKDKEKFKIIRVLGDDVVYQDLASRKVMSKQIDKLLNDWEGRGIKEISLLEDIINTVKAVLGPALGIFLTAALIAWITEQLR